MSSSSSSDLLDTIVKWMWRLGTIGVGVVALAGGLLYSQQEKLLYLPTVQGIPRHNKDNPRGYKSPADRGLPLWYSVRIPTVDGTHIHAWYILHPSVLSNPQQKVPTLIFFHGNAGNIGLRLPNVQYMMQNLGPVNVLLVDYRSYGDSDETLPPNEVGLKRDGQAAYEWIVSAASSSSSSDTSNSQASVEASTDELSTLTPAAFIDTSQLYLFGRSLGGAVAFSLAHHVQNNPDLPPLAGLIVENTFLSISAMVDRIFPFLKSIKRWVLRMDWNSHHLATRLKRVPILYLAGAQDDLVPHHHMQVLYQTSVLAGNQAVQLHVVPNGTHNETWLQGGKAYWKAIRMFLNAPKRGGASLPATSSTTSAFGDLASSLNDANSIPTMSQSIMDMAKEAFASSSSSSSNDKKKQ